MPAFKFSPHLASMALVATAGAAWASDPETDIAACARIAAADERIRCLESALRGAEPAADVTEDAGNDATEAAADFPGPASVDTATPAPVAKPSPTASAPAAVSAAADEAAGDGRTGDRAMTAGSAATAELGDEQLKRNSDDQRDKQRIKAEIVEFELVGTGRLRLTLDNGQVWQQTGDDDDRIARRIDGNDRIPVEMWQSRSGGYRMHIVDIDRTLRVRRLR